MGVFQADRDRGDPGGPLGCCSPVQLLERHRSRRTSGAWLVPEDIGNAAGPGRLLEYGRSGILVEQLLHIDHLLKILRRHIAAIYFVLQLRCGESHGIGECLSKVL